MSEPLLIKNEIVIHSPIQRVWDALIKPEQTKKYMFGCAALSDWKPGSTLLWEGEYEGNKVVFVKGHVIGIDAPYYLEYTVIDPNSTIPDVPENYLTVTYRLVEQNGSTTLTVTQGDYSKVADSEKRYQESYNNGEGWNPILVAIKSLVEG